MANDKSSGGDDCIHVEVAYALPEQQKIIALRVTPGTTAIEAVRQSGIAALFVDEGAGLDVESAALGVFGHAVERDHVLHDGDRIEIYRPLLVDPKESRKARAAEVKARRAQEK